MSLPKSIPEIHTAAELGSCVKAPPTLELTPVTEAFPARASSQEGIASRIPLVKLPTTIVPLAVGPPSESAADKLKVSKATLGLPPAGIVMRALIIKKRAQGFPCAHSS